MTRKGGLCAQKIIRISRDSLETIHRVPMVFGFWKKEGAVQRVNLVMPIKLQLVKIKTGGVRWMGKYAENCLFCKNLVL